MTTNNPHTIYESLVRNANLYAQAFFGHKRTPAQTRKLNQLWNESLDRAHGVAFVNKNGKIRLAEFGSKPNADEKRIPTIARIIWHDDQSKNQITFNKRQRANYEFVSALDFSVLNEYADQLVDILF